MEPEQLQLDARLDALLTRYMASVSDYLVLAESLQTRLSGGRIALSKSRYCAMLPAGVASAAIGRLQYREADMTAASATVVLADGEGEAATATAEFALEHQPDPGNRGPIRWFSALPPLSLRAARREFESALPLVVAMANEKARMARLDAEMAALKASIRGCPRLGDAGEERQ